MLNDKVKDKVYMEQVFIQQVAAFCDEPCALGFVGNKIQILEMGKSFECYYPEYLAWMIL